MDNLLSFLYFFAFYQVQQPLNLEKYRFWRILQDFEMFLKGSWSLEYQGFCIMPGAAISPWERLPFTLQFFQRKRSKHLTCFPFIDVIIYFNVVSTLNFSLIINCCLERSYDEFKIKKGCTKTLSCWVYLFLPQHQTLQQNYTKL